MEDQNIHLVTLQTVDNSFQANLLKAKLEASGIDSAIINENIVTLQPLYNNAMGGIKVQVKSSDLTRANDVLKEIANEPITNEAEIIIECPQCHSTKIENGQRAIKSASSGIAYIFALLTGTLPIHSDPIYRCNDCGKEFEQ